MLNLFRRRQNVHFLHIGKTGGSAIRAAIKAELKNQLKTDKFTIVFHGHRTSLSDIPAGEKLVFFLREPISRFVSGFYSRQRKGQPRIYSEWTDQEKAAFEKFTTPGELAEALADGDSDAVEAMCAVRHLSHYDKWYGDLDYFKSRLGDILFIGFQESLDTDFEILKSALGLPQSCALPTDEVAAHKNPANLDKSIAEQGISSLQQWYEDDYRFVSTCKKLMSGKAPE